jgi:hypothetical protein
MGILRSSTTKPDSVMDWPFAFSEQYRLRFIGIFTCRSYCFLLCLLKDLLILGPSRLQLGWALRCEFPSNPFWMTDTWSLAGYLKPRRMQTPYTERMIQEFNTPYKNVIKKTQKKNLLSAL